MVRDINAIRTLVLGKDYQPISLFPLMQIHAHKAVVRLVNGTCEVVRNYEDLPLRRARAFYDDPSLKFIPTHWPSVVRRVGLDRPNFKIGLNNDALFYRDNCKCQYCGNPVMHPDSNCEVARKKFTKDHWIPKSKGGKDTWENLVTACAACNTAKGDMMPGKIWVPKQTPFKPNYWNMVEKRKKHPITIRDPAWADYLYGWEGEIRIDQRWLCR